MPGAEIDGFAADAASIAAAGIYDFRIHYEQVLVPVVVNHWRLESVEGLDSDGERARDHLLGWMARLRRVAARIAAQSSEAADLAENGAALLRTSWARARPGPLLTRDRPADLYGGEPSPSAAGLLPTSVTIVVPERGSQPETTPGGAPGHTAASAFGTSLRR